MTREGRIGVAQAVAATGLFSTGAVLARWAQDLSPAGVTSLRMLLGGLFVAAAAWFSGERIALARSEFRRLISIGLIAAVVGHTLYNAALRRLHPSIPYLITTQAVTGGILLAWLLLHEVPTWNALAGAGITILGVGLVLR